MSCRPETALCLPANKGDRSHQPIRKTVLTSQYSGPFSPANTADRSHQLIQRTVLIIDINYHAQYNMGCRHLSFNRITGSLQILVKEV
jgi:hypothetical protein